MKLFSRHVQFASLAVVLAALVAGDALFAWTAPMASPTSSNVAAPLNTGAAPQDKEGLLGVGGLSVFGSAYVQGASTSDAFNRAVTLEVEGKIGADQYCDENGLNCTDLSTVASGQSNIRTQVQDWPDSIVCRENNGVTVVYQGGYLPYSNGYAYYYGPGAGWYKMYRLDQGFYSENVAGDCTGKSISQLASEGKAFSYGVENFTPTADIRYIVGGHALTKALQDAGVPGIAYWNVSSIGHRTAEMAWVCNYFYPGSTVVGSVSGAYSSPSNNGIHLLNASGQWQRYGASAYNSRIDGLYCDASN